MPRQPILSRNASVSKTPTGHSGYKLGPRVCGLAAGGEWIRTIGTRKISYRFETDFCRPGDGSDSQTDSFLSRRGTDGSNPAPSSGESIANRIFSVQARLKPERSRTDPSMNTAPSFKRGGARTSTAQLPVRRSSGTNGCFGQPASRKRRRRQSRAPAETC
jgi:hypothetical protein